MFRAPAFTEAALGLAYRPQLTAAGREVLLPSEEVALPALVSAAMDLPTNDAWFPVSRALASWERDRPTLPVHEDNRRAIIRPSHPWWRG